MPKDMIYIGISKKQIEKEIEKIVREYARRLVDYNKVKDVFYNELRKFAKSKVRKNETQR